ncbi:hypothetical protein JCM6882_005003 [Rhodosporidiobolus microsporus]
MAQGFKSKPPANTIKQKSSTQKKQTRKDPVKGARTIPPKKAGLVQQAAVKRHHTSSHASGLEKNIAAQALSYGKLTIMRKAAEEVKDNKDKEKK